METLKYFWSSNFAKTIFIISLLLIAYNIYCAWGIPIDDAYTTYRYANNLIKGYGPVYNFGDRVEGYSNFLWMILNSIALLLKINPLYFSTIISLILLLVLLIALLKVYHNEYLRHKNSSQGQVYCIFGLIPIITSMSIYFYISSGLETQMFITLFFISAFSQTDYLRTNFIFSGLLLGGLILTRSDGFVFAGIILSSSFLNKLIKREDKREVLLSGLISFIILVIYFAWRYSYYHSLLPNPYYAKTSFGLSQIKEGLIYTITFLKDNIIWVFLIILGIHIRKNLYLLLILIGIFLYITIIGGDWMPHHRFYQVLIPIFAYFIGWSIFYIYKHKKISHLFIYVFIIFVITVNIYNTIHEYSMEKLITGKNEKVYAVQTSKKVGMYIDQHCPKNESIAFSGAGIVPFYTDRYIIDTMGINDYHIAHLPGGIEDGDADYVLSKRPFYILLFHSTVIDGSVSSFVWAGGRAIYEHPDFSNNYILEKTFSTCNNRTGRYFHLYKRKKNF